MNDLPDILYAACRLHINRVVNFCMFEEGDDHRMDEF